MLIGLLLPAVQAARESARRIACGNNTKQLALGINSLYSTRKVYPPQFGWLGGEGRGSYGGTLFHLLPFIEQQTLMNKALIKASDRVMDSAGVCPFNRVAGTYDSRWTVGSEELSVFQCPSDSTLRLTLSDWGWGGATYASNFQVFGKQNATPTQGKTSLCDVENLERFAGVTKERQISDGLSKTLFFAEKWGVCNSTGPFPGVEGGGNMWARWDSLDYWHPTFAAWTTGTSSVFQLNPLPFTNGGNCDPLRAQTSHAGGIVTGFGDGSVRTLAPSLSGVVWWALCTPSGGETATAD